MLWFFNDSGDPWVQPGMSLEAVAAAMGFSHREEAWRMERRVLHKLRAALSSREGVPPSHALRDRGSIHRKPDPGIPSTQRPGFPDLVAPRGFEPAISSRATPLPPARP